MHGTGNDFILINNIKNTINESDYESLAIKLCDRHFGIGADGLILSLPSSSSDIRMRIFNADGSEAEMCGNGGRCMVAFAKKLQLFDKTTKFLAIDGVHHASIEASTVSLQMIDVHEVKVSKKSIFTDTGSPHHVEIVDHLDDYPVVKQARKIINTNYSTEGCNINFVEQLNDESFKVRTYERGVENETLACGTGATAVAIAMHKINKSSSNHIKLAVLGGNLEVQFNAEQGSYTNIVLSGPAAFVFEGTIAIS